MKTGYDHIASFYDRLSRLVYGKTLINAQLFLLDALKTGTNILIVGGGTGWILEEISKRYPSGLSITYIDSSEKMIAIARKRDLGDNKIIFISSPLDKAIIGGRFDYAITPFFFDNFSQESLQTNFSIINSHLSPTGQWLHCDFRETGVLWQVILLKIMYLFFRVFCGIEARKLPDTEGCFMRYGLKVIQQKIFLNGFIVAYVFER